MCVGNVSSTAEYLVDWSDVKMEIDSSFSDEEQPESSPVSLQCDFVPLQLGEAHSLPPEEFQVDRESDEESFHSAENSAETDEPNNDYDTTAQDNNEEDNENVDRNDEMEVTTTVQECADENY